MKSHVKSRDSRAGDGYCDQIRTGNQGGGHIYSLLSNIAHISTVIYKSIRVRFRLSLSKYKCISGTLIALLTTREML